MVYRFKLNNDVEKNYLGSIKDSDSEMKLDFYQEQNNIIINSNKEFNDKIELDLKISGVYSLESKESKLYILVSHDSVANIMKVIVAFNIKQEI